MAAHQASVQGAALSRLNLMSTANFKPMSVCSFGFSERLNGLIGKKG
jgi:hypothetical protein